MLPTSADCRTTNNRGAPRTSIYLAAALHCEGSSLPVKIRNISENGALLEGTAFPGQGAPVQLVRGSLVAHGLVAWSTAGRCGLRLSGSLDVQQWRASRANAEQQRVDEVVRHAKAGAVPLIASRLGSPGFAGEVRDSGAQLARDLGRIRQLLEKVGGELASDSEVVSRHAPTLQSLDIAGQVLEAVEAALGQADLTPAAGRLLALRPTVEQALRRSP